MTAVALPTVARRSDEASGMLLGLAGVAIFSFTLPFTRLAVAGLDPIFATTGRAVVAALLAGLWLWWQRAELPSRAALGSLALVAAGCVIGSPLMMSLAMRSVPASHGAVLMGILPLATALVAALRGHERPSVGFWCTALAGTSLVIVFALRDSGGLPQLGDLYMLGAVATAAIGYAEGGRLAQRMGGQQVISWALVLALPVSLPLTAWEVSQHGAALAAAGAAAWAGFAYLSVFSMFIGFVFWYRGMALGGVARVGQVQLLQPFLSLLGAALVLGEPLQAANLGFALAVIGIVALGRRMAVTR